MAASDQFANSDSKNITTDCSCSVNPSHIFEMGRFYDEYSARRSERKKRLMVDEAYSEGKTKKGRLYDDYATKRNE